MSKENVHIGSSIEKVLRGQERPVSWFSHKIHRCRKVVYDIFKSKYINHYLLKKICITLKHNFVRELSDEIDEILQNEKNVTKKVTHL